MNQLVISSRLKRISAVLLFCASAGLHAQQFHGYDCTQDCSGHEAGYAWAEANEVTDPDDCGGNSNSFIEGCMAYAEEYQDSYGDDENGEPYWDDEALTEDGEPCEDYPEECEEDYY